MTPAEHRRKAAEIRIEIRRLIDEAELHDRTADELERLQAKAKAVTINTVTAEQAQARGAAIARSLAGKHPLLRAIVGSKWGSAERYAKERLGVSGAAFTQWRSGARKTPARVAALVEQDFGLAPTKALWPGGIGE